MNATSEVAPGIKAVNKITEKPIGSESREEGRRFRKQQTQDYIIIIALFSRGIDVD